MRFGFGKILVITVIIVCLIVLGFWGFKFCSKIVPDPIIPNDPSAPGSVSVTNIVTALQKSSDLVAAKVKFTGVARYDDKGIPFLNKSDFVMLYNATVKAGIDIAKVCFAVDDSGQTVYIYVPQAEIISVEVDAGSLEFFQEGFALFNTDEKNDAAKALNMATEDAKKDALDTGVLELADHQSQTLIRGILSSVVHNYTLKFVNSEDEILKYKTQLSMVLMGDEMSAPATADTTAATN